MADLLPPVLMRFMGDTSSLTRAFGQAESRTAAFGKSMTKLGGLTAVALVGIGVESVKMASSFDAAMERVHTQAGASQKEVDNLKSKVLALAPTVGIGPERLAEGLYHVESAGFRSKQALDITANAAKLAAIGNANLEDVSQAMIATVASGIPGVNGMSDAAALLNKTVGIGDMKMQQLAKAMATGILPSARVAGLSFKDVAASLATITDNATPADETATRLRMTFSLMSSPSHAAAKALGTIHMSATQMADDMRKPNGLLVALEDLKGHLEKSGMSASQQAQVLQRAFGGGKTSGSILTLLTQMDRLKDKYKELGTSGERAKEFQEAWAKTQETFQQRVKRLRAEFDTLMIELGNKLIPIIEKVVGWFSKHQEVAVALAATVGGVLVAAFLAWAAAVLANPLTWIIVGLEALVVAVVELWKHWNQVWGWIQHHKAYAAILAILMPIPATFVALVGAVKYLYTHWSQLWNSIKSITTAVWNGIKGTLSGTWSAISHAASSTWHAITSAVSASWRVIKAILSTSATVINYLLIPLRVAAALWIQTWKHVIAPTLQWAWGSVISPIFHAISSVVSTVVIGAIHALRAAWNAAWAAVSAVLRAVWGVLSPILSAVGHAVGSAIVGSLHTLHSVWNSVWGGIRGFVQSVWNDVRPILDAVARAVDAVTSKLHVFSSVAHGVSGAAGWLNKKLPFAEGGYVSGPGSGTSDSIPAWLSNGEYVVKADAVRAIGVPALDAINAVSGGVNSTQGQGQQATYATGGKVAYNTSGPRVWIPAHQGGGSKGTHIIPGHWQYLTAKQVTARQSAASHKTVAQQLKMAETAERARATLTSKTSGSLGAMSRAVASLTSHHTLTDATIAHTRGMQAQLDKQRADAWNAAQFAQAAARKLEHDPRATAAQRKQAETLAARAFREYSSVRTVDDKARKLAADTYQALVKQRSVEWRGAAATYGHGGSWGARSHAPVTVQIDGREVFKVVQKQALQSSRRNVNNLLTPA